MVPLHSVSDFDKKAASMMTLPHQHDHSIDALGYDIVDDYALPLHKAEKPWQHLAQTLPSLHRPHNNKNNTFNHEEATSAIDYPTHADKALQTQDDVAKEESSIRFVDKSDAEMIMELLGEQLEEEMLAIEEGDEMYHQETSVRVMFMGAATEKDKRVCVRKLSQALMIRSRYKLASYNHFKERKHHIVREVSEIDEQSPEDNDCTFQTFEELGLSIIEADFSWATGRRKQAVDYAGVLLKHCGDEPDLLLKDNQDQEGVFMLYPRTTQDESINLCIYFFEDSHYLNTVEEDMDTLQQLQAMGMPILPILVGGVTESDDVSTHRARLADLLAFYKIRPKTFAAVLVDAGPSPSFSRRSRRYYQVSNRATKVENQCAGSDNTRSAFYYDILTIDHFAALDGRIISTHILEDCARSQNQRPKKKDDAVPLQPSSCPDAACQDRLLIWLLMVILGVLLAFATVIGSWNRPSSGPPLTAHVSLSRRNEDSRTFIHFNVCDDVKPCEHRHIPIPTCPQPVVVPLGTIYIDTSSSRVNHIQHDPVIMCPTTTTKLSEDKDKFVPTKSYHQRERSSTNTGWDFIKQLFSCLNIIQGYSTPFTPRF